MGQGIILLKEISGTLIFTSGSELIKVPSKLATGTICEIISVAEAKDLPITNGKVAIYIKLISSNAGKLWFEFHVKHLEHVKYLRATENSS